MIHERAFAKLNLALRVARPRDDGLHPVCSVFASIDLADEVYVEPADADAVECSGLDGPNLAAAALAAFRTRVPELPPLHVRVEKRIPVAAGLGGGSADAAATLRAANRIAGEPLDAAALRDLGAGLGSDVPSQIEPRHALVSGVGEVVEPIELPLAFALLVPQPEGLATAAVYAEFDRMGLGREQLECEELRALFAPGASGAPGGAAPGGEPALHNDLQPAALSLRPELAEVLEQLRAAAGTDALVSGSGPTCFALFGRPGPALTAAAGIEGALVTSLRSD
jgi:4-diphosphocytidyl-2-C-methyl-D-erythritol kinase